MLKTPREELALDVTAYYDASGNKSEAARARGLPRATYLSRLDTAQVRLGVRLDKKVAGGQVVATRSLRRKLPGKGRRKFYLLTSVQNNTHLHLGFNNLLAYRDWLDALPDAECELLVGTYSYQIGAYGSKAVKRGTHDRVAIAEDLWYAPEAVPYIEDRSVVLAPGLVWCGELNILPTARHPLTSMEDYNGRLSNIVPHAKFAMESVASMADEATKFNYTTGTISQRHYIQKRVGILAEQQHSYGFLLVEVDSDGNWYVRQVTIDDEDAIMDTGPHPYGGLRVQAGRVCPEAVVESIYWGDVHVAEMEMWVRELCWGPDGMLDALAPSVQFMGDIFSMRSRSPHEEKDFWRTYEKYVDGEETVENEVKLTADFMAEADRIWCETIVVASNHDRHLVRWLNDADFRKDPVNAKFFCLLQFQALDAMDRGDRGFNILEWALKRDGAPEGVRFLDVDESFVVAGVENGLHGDLGPNGSRGSTAGLTKLGRPVNKGHDHTAAVRGFVYSAGACSRDFPYEKGPTSHSVAHILTYKNGSRTIVSPWSYKWRA